ncbi:hypothetical protein GW17_00031779 [Ensete ventricosum]|nr:hypothetical protein GW17_00031779 [Ensete ventricosum]
MLASDSSQNDSFDACAGEIYYINRETGVRTTEKPRTAAAFSSAYSSSYYCDGDGTSDEYSCSRVGSEDNDYEEEDGSEDNDYKEEEDGSYTADSSTLSCTSPHPRSPPPTRNPVAKFSSPLAARPASSTSWSPKGVDACPKCGGGCLHLGLNNCI